MVDATVALLSCQSGKTKNSTTFLKCTVADAHANKLLAKLWDASNAEVERTAQILWARIRGKATRYDNAWEIELSHPVEEIPEPTDAEQYLPASPVPLVELLHRLNKVIVSIENPCLSALLQAIFVDDTKTRERFALLPAAQERHHAFRHGLLQHTLEVTDVTEALIAAQRSWGGRGRLSRDLAITGALLHDIGKLDEYEQDGHGVRYSVGGSLLGHTVQGVVFIAKKISQVRKTLRANGVFFSQSLENIVLHLIAAHHGQGDFGAPTAPGNAEAHLIHTADKLSADFFYFAEAEANVGRGEYLAKQWKLDNGFGGKGRSVFVGAVDGLWEDKPSVKEVTPTPTELVFPIPMPPLPKVPTLPVLRAGSRLADIAPFPSVRLPLIGQIAAGQPLDSTNREDDVDIEAGILGKHAASSYLLRVVGDSMSGDGIEDGDLIVVRKQEQADYGDIVVAQLAEGATVKRLAYQSGVVKLMPSNPEHTPIVISDAEPLRIQGRVVAIVR